MDALIRELVEVRGYIIKDGKVFEDSEEIAFFFVPLFDQEYLNRMYLDRYSIVFCEKQKKLRIPQDVLSNIEIHILSKFKLYLQPHKFRPRHVKLRGEELENMSRHYCNLPILLSTDPMSIVHGFKVGDIVKIYRLNGSLYFRRVEDALRG